jgi:hypothetical protein
VAFPAEAAAEQSPAPIAADRFFAWEHLLLLLTPFPTIFVAKLAYVLGLNNDGVDRVIAVYAQPAFLLSLTTLFVAPVVIVLAIVWLILRNFWLDRPKRLALYGVVLLALPCALRFTDGDWLRFKLQQEKFDALVARTVVEKGSAVCRVFDRIQDNFYIGGANFSPYEKLIIYVSEEAAGEDNPRLERFLPGGDCPSPQTVRHVRQLSGRYYLGSTYHY